MGKAKDRITPKTVAAKKAAIKPSVKVATPKVEVSPQIIVGTEAIAAAISPIMGQINASIEASLAAQIATNDKMATLIDHQNKLIKAFEKLKPGPINVSSPARPNDFSVEFDDENGDSATMRIRANAPH